MNTFWKFGTKIDSIIEIYVNSNCYEDLLSNKRSGELAKTRTLVQRFEVYAYFGLIDFGSYVTIIGNEYMLTGEKYKKQYGDKYLIALIKYNEFVKNSYYNKKDKQENISKELVNILLNRLDNKIENFDTITYSIYETILYNISDSEDKKYISENNGINGRHCTDWLITNVSDDKRIIEAVSNVERMKISLQNDNENYVDYKCDESFKIEEYIDVSTYKVRDIFNKFNGEIYFKIPYYQRNYVWTKELVEKLIDDIQKADNNSPKLLPAINCSVKSTGFGVNEKHSYNIVDGQQRITTLYLIYKSILNISEFYGLCNQEYFKYKSNINNIKFVRGSTNYNVFSNINNDIELSLKDRRNNNMGKIYYHITNYLTKKINTKSDLINFAKSFLDYTLITIVGDRISNELDLFDKLNTNNIPLTIFDKMKAIIFYEYFNNRDVKDEEYLSLDYDKKVTNLINEHNLNTSAIFKIMCRKHNIIGVNDNEKLTKYIKYIKEQYNDSFDINCLNQEINKINDFLRIYIYISKNEGDLTDINKHYMVINDFIFMFKKREVYYPFIFKSLDSLNENNYNIIRESLFELESFEMKFKVIQNSGQSLTDVIDRIYLKTFYNNQFDSENIRFVLEKDDYASYSYKSSINTFANKLKGPIKDSNLICKLLYRVIYNNINSGINIRLTSFQNVQIIDPSDEHILPQSSDNIENIEEYNEIIQKIGNRLIVNKSDNGSLSNKEYKEKKSLYNNLSYLKNNILYDFENDLNLSNKLEFTLNDVDRRTDALINELSKIYF